MLQVKNLVTKLYTKKGTIKAVDDLSFQVKKGKILGIVGESGSGKSMMALSIMGLISPDQGSIEGEILLKGNDIAGLPEQEMRKIRGNKISMIFQEPMTSLNPVLTIGYQIAEALVLHKGLTDTAALEKSIELLHAVGIPEPAKRVKEYPHQLSGGQRQRVMIAIALACEPDILIADEPTTALDVTIQAQILDLLVRLQKEKEMVVIFITHDLGVVAEICDEVAVMYAGKIVEHASVEKLFAHPRHPYTKGLLQSIPTYNPLKKEKLFAIKGKVPSFFDLPKGCSFQDRCDFATDECKKGVPLKEAAEGHYVACYHPLNTKKTHKKST